MLYSNQMIQYNLSLFIEPSIESEAKLALSKIIIPELRKFEGIQQIYLFGIDSHQEKDSLGLSLQFWIHPEKENELTVEITEIISSFFQAEFPNQYVYFPSKLSLIQTN